MMRDTIEMVAEFHEVFELHDHTRSAPTIPDAQVSLIRIQALTEEVAELARAMANGDIVEILDGLTDIQYFLDGTYIACGLKSYKMAAMVEVHRSNMTKLDNDGRPVREPGGRVVKGPCYEPPRLDKVLGTVVDTLA